MDELSAQLLDELSPEELVALEIEATVARPVFLRHVVGIAGAYEHLDPKGIRSPKEPFYYSGAVLEIGSEWYLATAGHNLKKMDAAAGRPDMRLVACGLDDTHTPFATHQAPIDCFDYSGSRRFWVNKEEVDFGLIHLRKSWRDLLTANGIAPLTEDHWNPSDINACDVFVIAGFPEELLQSEIALASTHYNARVKGRLCLLVVARQVVGDGDRRFVGQVRPEHVGSVLGLSGGPIFGIRESDHAYFVAAIQCSKLRNSTTTFGFPIPRILDLASNFLQDTKAQNS